MKQSYIYINKTGFFGEFLFEKLLGHDPSRWNDDGTSEKISEEINLNELQNDKTKSYYLKYPSFEELLKNINKLKEYDIIFLLRKDQKKEIEFLEQYYPVKKMNWDINNLEKFSGISLPESHDEKYEFAKKNIKGKIIIILAYGSDYLDLNPSYLLNIKGKLHEYYRLSDFFRKSDFKKINLDKFALTNSLIDKEEDVEEVANQFFYDLMRKSNPIKELIKKIDKLGMEDEEKGISIDEFSDEEKLCLDILKYRGDIYEPEPNFFKRM